MGQRWRGVIAVVVVGLSAVGGAQSRPEEAAQRADVAWLALVDAGKYPESWTEASPIFQQAVTESQWVKALESVRAPLGKTVTRVLGTAKYTTTLPGAPDGEYVVAQYRTSFEHKRDAVETVTAALDKDGVWKLTGYYIK